MVDKKELKVVRKLTKRDAGNGYSVTRVTIPPDIMEAVKLEDGDDVIIQADEKNKQIIIKKF